MKERVEERSALRVIVDFADSVHRNLGVSWRVDTAQSRIFESARIFLVALDAGPHRTYLGLVDWLDRTSIELPEALPAGSYAIDVDAYGSASWGDGRLDARGRSVAFTVEPGGDQRGAAGS
ncbi:hypothetical protein ACFXHA_26775 [Nocardia sp. NPDC059240]|uniref:hypothetical protein n=1 Tax=Nocardia sp. NPDC059240 TaxID=3346786 RepID=UPI00367CE322